jgi:hypothetical protein
VFKSVSRTLAANSFFFSVYLRNNLPNRLNVRTRSMTVYVATIQERKQHIYKDGKKRKLLITLKSLLTADALSDHYRLIYRPLPSTPYFSPEDGGSTFFRNIAVRTKYNNVEEPTLPSHVLTSS